MRRANVSRDELGTEVLSCATRIYSQNISLLAWIFVAVLFGTSLMVMPYCLMPLQALRNRNEVSDSDLDLYMIVQKGREDADQVG